MLLYQLTQWFEERTSLHKALLSGEQDPSLLQSRIDEVEKQLYTQAERWKQAVEEAAFLEIPYEAPHLDDDTVL